MKLGRIFLTASIFIALAWSQAAFAHETKEGDQTITMHSEAVMDNQASQAAKKVLMQVQSSVHAIEQMVSDGKLTDIHAEILKAETSVRSIIDKVSVTGGPGTRLNTSLQQLAAELSKIHKSPNDGDAATVAADLKRIKKALKVVEAAMN